MWQRRYFGFRNSWDNRLCRVAMLGERWLALVGWHPAAPHHADCDRWIEWDSEQDRRWPFGVVNEARNVLEALMICNRHIPL